MSNNHNSISLNSKDSPCINIMLNEPGVSRTACNGRVGCWGSPAQPLLVPSPAGLVALFYCLTTLEVAQLLTLSGLCQLSTVLGNTAQSTVHRILGNTAHPSLASMLSAVVPHTSIYMNPTIEFLTCHKLEMNYTLWFPLGRRKLTGPKNRHHILILPKKLQLSPLFKL
jgi:hypothetical protein